MNPRNYWKFREQIGKYLAIAIGLAAIVQLIVYLVKR